MSSGPLQHLAFCCFCCPISLQPPGTPHPPESPGLSASPSSGSPCPSRAGTGGEGSEYLPILPLATLATALPPCAILTHPTLGLLCLPPGPCPSSSHLCTKLPRSTLPSPGSVSPPCSVIPTGRITRPPDDPPGRCRLLTAHDAHELREAEVTTPRKDLHTPEVPDDFSVPGLLLSAVHV